jgi:hypothetical protein
MERPFDYPGSESCITDAAFHHMRKLSSWLANHDDGDCATNWSIWSVPDSWSDDDMWRIIEDRFGEEHCAHAYDCCGHMYARRAQWAWHPHYVETGDKAVVISQRFIRNI